MIPFSILDLSPVVEGGDVSTSLANSRALAQAGERLGYNRFWLAEHHGMQGIASAATSVVIGHVAAGTSKIRVGAGGIMLPNHAPLLIAEQFGTLAALHPGRIDLGLGRAPGSDGVVAQAMKRDLYAAAERFPADVQELMSYFAGSGPVRAVPGEGEDVPVWILGSSLYGAQVAAHFGLPYAFASHFAPTHMHEAIRIYRERFQPSERLKKPYVMLGYNVVAAETDEEAQFLSTSLLQAFVNLSRGTPGRLPRPVEGYEKDLPPDARARLSGMLSASAIGSADTVANTIVSFIEKTGADELILSASVHDFEKRVRSYEIAADVHARLAAA
ncbi:LLM class flavin-dependent oxidoreductase [Pacificimonas sp. ICDLI1SI03]